MRMRGIIPAAALLLITSLPADAQQQSWSAWHGCWQGVGADVPPGEMLCVLPGADALSVRLATVADGKVVSEVALRADDVARPVEEGGCKGTERAAFSADGRRIYTHSEMDCGTGTIKRSTTGMIAMINEAEWIDAQAVTVEGQHGTRTVRFKSVSPSSVPADVAAQLPPDQRLAQETARLHASAPITTDQIAEASRVVAPPVVEAMLAARAQGFDLNANALRNLKEAGIATSTIDVMVALSYPERFAVQEQVAATGEMPSTREYRDDCYYDPFFGMYGIDCDRYSRRYGYGRFGYSPFGYSSYGYSSYGYNGYYNRPPVIVVVTPSEEVRGGGSVVKGRGYTRGQTSTTSRPSTSSTSSSRPSTTSSGSGSSTSTGSSAGRDASPPPVRTAKPRGGGNL